MDITRIGQELEELVAPLQNLAKLGAWAGKHEQRFFEFTRFSDAEWDATVYSIGLENATFTGVTFAEVVAAAVDWVEER